MFQTFAASCSGCIVTLQTIVVELLAEYSQREESISSHF